MVFTDRSDAGRQLAERLLARNETDPVVLALPRGGVPVGFEIARALTAPLDLVLVRKIGAPCDEELAIGAVADGTEPELVTDAELIADLDVPAAYLDAAKSAALREIERRRRLYLGDQAPVSVTDRTAIVVDDGIATGATMLAALRMTRRRKPARILLAVPVVAQPVLRRLRREVDAAVSLHTPADLASVGHFYHRFPQLRDEEVIALLDRARGFAPTPDGHSKKRSNAASPG
jgi:putative phosphoribosyl transferase